MRPFAFSETDYRLKLLRDHRFWFDGIAREDQFEDVPVLAGVVQEALLMDAARFFKTSAVLHGVDVRIGSYEFGGDERKQVALI